MRFLDSSHGWGKLLEVAPSGVPSHGFPATPREVQVQNVAEVDYVGRVKVQEGLRPMLPAVEAAIVSSIIIIINGPWIE